MNNNDTRAKFEEWWNTPHKEDHIVGGMMKVEARYVWMKSSESRDTELEEYKAELERVDTEKDDLLLLLKEKDRIIESMRCCGNCQKYITCTEDLGIMGDEFCDNWESKL